MIQNFLNFCTNIFFNKYIWNVCIYLQKNMKGWSHKKIIFYFFCIFDLLSKKLENNFFVRAALLCANISQIFFSQLDRQKYLLPVYSRICSTGPLTFPHPSASLLEFQLNLMEKSTTTEMGFNSYPNISRKWNWFQIYLSEMH